tara:strand:+ start:3919 stop:4044 length:126 start_codon:yes stop_codon:yes gene_type:complete
MEQKEIKTYKPKKINIIKLEAYLKQIKNNGKQHKLGGDLLQ